MAPNIPKRLKIAKKMRSAFGRAPETHIFLYVCSARAGPGSQVAHNWDKLFEASLKRKKTVRGLQPHTKNNS